MTRPVNSMALSAAAMASLFFVTAGCESKIEAPHVVVPPPIAVSETSNTDVRYDYPHEVRYGGADGGMRQALREKFTIAVARIGDTSLVDTPFGDKVVASPVAAIVAKAEGQGETKVTAGIDDSLRNPKLRPEPTPSGFSQTTRSQLISFLQGTECFTIVERESINDIVRELKFGDSRWVAGEDAPPHGKLQSVRYIVKGSMELNYAPAAEPTTADNWVGTVGFPEGSRDDLPLVFRLRMYSVESGIIVAVGDGYGSNPAEAVENSVRALVSLVVRNYRTEKE